MRRLGLVCLLCFALASPLAGCPSSVKVGVTPGADVLNPGSDTEPGRDVLDALPLPVFSVEACVVSDDTCQQPLEIDYGSVDVGAVVPARVRLTNAGDVTARVTELAVTHEAFSIRLLNDADEVVEVPSELAAGESVIVEITFEAFIASGPLPDAEATIMVTDYGTEATDFLVTLKAEVAGCPQGYGDCDDDLSNGCETEIPKRKK